MNILCVFKILWGSGGIRVIQGAKCDQTTWFIKRHRINFGDTSLNGIVMGFPPLPAPVLLETAFPCRPVALFGAHCAMSPEAAVSLAGFNFHVPTIDLARSSWWLRLHFGICCLSGFGFICNESSDIETMEGVPTTNSQSETSRQKQCESVSKKSGGLNLSLYHLE